MPMYPSKFIPHEMKTSIIKVLTYDDKKLTGVIVNPFFGNGVFFDNAIQLLFLMDEMQDSLNYPKESVEIRSLRTDGGTSRVPKRNLTESELSQLHPVACFKINVMFRQNASWQGSIVWMEKMYESQFRSVLELIMLMDNVLSDSISEEAEHLAVANG